MAHPQIGHRPQLLVAQGPVGEIGVATAEVAIDPTSQLTTVVDHDVAGQLDILARPIRQLERIALRAVERVGEDPLVVEIARGQVKIGARQQLAPQRKFHLRGGIVAVGNLLGVENVVIVGLGLVGLVLGGQQGVARLLVAIEIGRLIDGAVVARLGVDQPRIDLGTGVLVAADAATDKQPPL